MPSTLEGGPHNKYDLEYLYSSQSKLRLPPELIGESPAGLRLIVYREGGELVGPRLRGRFLPVGGDWLIVRPDGMGVVDARGTIETHDGALIYNYYSGLADFGENALEQIRRGQLPPRQDRPHPPPLRDLPPRLPLAQPRPGRRHRPSQPGPRRLHHRRLRPPLAPSGCPFHRAPRVRYNRIHVRVSRSPALRPSPHRRSGPRPPARPHARPPAATPCRPPVRSTSTPRPIRVRPASAAVPFCPLPPPPTRLRPAPPDAARLARGDRKPAPFRAGPHDALRAHPLNLPRRDTPRPIDPTPLWPRPPSPSPTSSASNSHDRRALVPG